ncbi:amidohydrolase family protein [soil metagenome]
MAIVDTHMHVFVPGLPLAAVRRYVPDYAATVDDYRARMQAFGITQAVIVQPSFLGTDNSFMCAALREHRELFRGIAVVEPGIDDAALDALADDGVVGIRLNLDGLPIPDFEAEPWPGLLERLRVRGWQVEVHRDGRDLAELCVPLLDAGLDVVVDHFGRPAESAGSADAGFRYLLAGKSDGRLWVKLSGAYRNGWKLGDPRARQATDALLDSLGPQRLVWGSDWPHTRFESRASIETALAQIRECVRDAVQLDAILGATAIALFDFDRPRQEEATR